MTKKKEKLYRYVSDFGYGDRSWIKRFMSTKEAIKYWNKEHGTDFETIEEVMNVNKYEYSLEIDNYNDVEDWDFLDS